MKNLTESQREEIYERFLEGQSIRQIAATMGLCRKFSVAPVIKAYGLTTDTRARRTVVEYNGVRYTKTHDSGYWISTTRPRRYLHREKYLAEVGEIPDGHHIHHKDHNPDNNDIANLECIRDSEHGKKHHYTGQEAA